MSALAMVNARSAATSASTIPLSKKRCILRSRSRVRRGSRCADYPSLRRARGATLEAARSSRSEGLQPRGARPGEGRHADREADDSKHEGEAEVGAEAFEHVSIISACLGLLKAISFAGLC